MTTAVPLKDRLAAWLWLSIITCWIPSVSSGDASCCPAYVAVLDLFVISDYILFVIRTSSARRSPEDCKRT